ncbi:hypothetical protein E2C01_086190 [Portunus trituberculatus]|uniref:Uncharacterized protein n=1 Tax=Portunus trituberculatus TaxID=210409 RepID=A0A5B7J039_PORTR|nr:hypothetical protein [Portunus trituberculatus]
MVAKPTKAKASPTFLEPNTTIRVLPTCGQWRAGVTVAGEGYGDIFVQYGSRHLRRQEVVFPLIPSYHRPAIGQQVITGLS